MMDGLRLLPIVGCLLWMLPLFWQVDVPEGDLVRMSSAILFVFGVWVLLIVVSFVLSRMLGQVPFRDTTLLRETGAAPKAEEPDDGAAG